MADLDPLATLGQRPSLLPFDPADMISIRVRPADFARLSQVSKQTVSQWIKKGIVTLGPDGMLDPNKGARQVLQRTNIARLRAKLFKLAAETQDEMRARMKALQCEIVSLKGPDREARDLAIEARFMDHQALQISEFCTALVERFEELANALAKSGPAQLEELLDEIVSSVFYPEDETDPSPDTDTSGALSNEDGDLATVVVAGEAGEELFGGQQ